MLWSGTHNSFCRSGPPLFQFQLEKLVIHFLAGFQERTAELAPSVSPWLGEQCYLFSSMASQPAEQIDGARETPGSGAKGRQGQSHPEHPAQDRRE